MLTCILEDTRLALPLGKFIRACACEERGLDTVDLVLRWRCEAFCLFVLSTPLPAVDGRTGQYIWFRTRNTMSSPGSLRFPARSRRSGWQVDVYTACAVEFSTPPRSHFQETCYGCRWFDWDLMQGADASLADTVRHLE